MYLICTILVIGTIDSASFCIQEDTTLLSLCEQWNNLYLHLLYGTSDRMETSNQIKSLTGTIKSRMPVSTDSIVYFPLEGYGIQDIGGNGSGFQPRGYYFNEGNDHRGHPAHDIFIRDADLDCLDDNTFKPVYVLAMAGGIVLSVKDDWRSGDTLRGGNYILIYNGFKNRYYYYAHNRDVLVKVGDIIGAGTRIATVGRTGVNAYKKRSPTHLHLMVLQITGEKPEPYNFYKDLKKAVFK